MAPMNTDTAIASDTWIAACAHALQRRWRSVDPDMLEAVASELYCDEQLKLLPPTQAAARWLSPVVRQAH